MKEKYMWVDAILLLLAVVFCCYREYVGVYVNPYGAITWIDILSIAAVILMFIRLRVRYM